MEMSIRRTSENHNSGDDATKKKRLDASNIEAPYNKGHPTTNDNSRTKQLATTPARRKKSTTKTGVQAPALWEAVDWDSIDWEGICNDYRRMVGYSNAHFAKSISPLISRDGSQWSCRRLDG
jgi:hypothetical protein